MAGAAAALALAACDDAPRDSAARPAAAHTAEPERPRGAVENCSTRSEASFPKAFTDRRNVVVGPLVLIGAASTSAATVRRFGGNKFPALVRAGHRVTVALSPQHAPGRRPRLRAAPRGRRVEAARRAPGRDLRRLPARQGVGQRCRRPAGHVLVRVRADRLTSVRAARGVGGLRAFAPSRRAAHGRALAASRFTAATGRSTRCGRCAPRAAGRRSGAGRRGKRSRRRRRRPRPRRARQRRSPPARPRSRCHRPRC